MSDRNEFFWQAGPISTTRSILEYRVMVEHRLDNKEYLVYTGDNLLRRFTEDTLPQPLKHKIVMVKAYEANVPKLNIWGMSPITMWIRSYPEQFDDIGWYVGEDANFKVYCVVLSMDHLNELRGAKHE